MIPLSVEKIAEIVSGEIIGVDPKLVIAGDFFFDSRSPVKNGVFIALKGEINDGHDFLNSAIAGGAAIALVSKIGRAHV